jgi:hypothetical protein
MLHELVLDHFYQSPVFHLEVKWLQLILHGHVLQPITSTARVNSTVVDKMQIILS